MEDDKSEVSEEIQEIGVRRGEATELGHESAANSCLQDDRIEYLRTRCLPRLQRILTVLTRSKDIIGDFREGSDGIEVQDVENAIASIKRKFILASQIVNSRL